MSIDSEDDLIALKKIGKIVAMAREAMIQAIKPGITTSELDAIAEAILSEHGARSAPKYEYNFPGVTCISLNDVAAHGIPGSRVLREGDIVNVDVSAELDGYYADTGATVAVGSVSPVKKNLIECSRAALSKAIEKTKAGTKINQIGRAISNEARRCGFTVVRNLTGHGIGRKLHEEPHDILNYCIPSDNRLLAEGTVLAVETFISTGAQYVVEENDGWTLRTPDGSFVAQFEHTIVVTRNEPIILTTV
ncbi:methionyl aminopeptidase [Anaerosolibacter carboniphilus]|uniref:Methionine aminopeptidase n=1 Tax=Anaerosolibacter carboniphilus TaxID=1417629 RepID=A0A841KZT8_9FIRM|nr:type I methionyl aminopeptidase [Anaerosolibacter carboniphilus]MBB6218823.1 methionyl aminopeptidase [Anaerosolibacter carboniphilus]